MKSYIIENITPMLIGLVVGLLYSHMTNLLENIVVKIALIHAR
jgi:hypothetical protein